MWPSEVPSDLDVEDASLDELDGRSAILCDLHSEFQGATGAYAFFAFLWPGLLIASVVFGVQGWPSERPGLVLMIAAVLFIMFATISLYSWVWLRWVRRRRDQVEKLTRLKAESEGQKIWPPPK